MPRSIIIYTDKKAFSHLQSVLDGLLKDRQERAYTLSFAHETGTGGVRVRITELNEDVVLPFIRKMTDEGQVVAASAADRDVRVQTYEELMENADRFNRTASLHFASPTIINLDGAETPFPVVPVLLHHYMDVWNLFSPTAIAGGGEWVGRVRLRDFKISCVMTPFGPGFQGWITLELDKGRTELEIASFNALLDFAFYSGTGLYTSRGLGQTRRVERKGRN